MTKAAQHFAKRVENFLASVEAREYIREAARLIPGKSVINGKRGFGGHPSVGTWAHPKLAVFFARWLDVRFSVWCDAMIEDIQKGGAEVTIVKPMGSS